MANSYGFAALALITLVLTVSSYGNDGHFRFEGRSVKLASSASLDAGTSPSAIYDMTPSQNIRVSVASGQTYPTTDLNLYPCSGGSSYGNVSSGPVTFASSNGYFCFTSPAYVFKIEFLIFGSDGSYPRWIGVPNGNTTVSGIDYPFSRDFVNVRDFGAKGNTNGLGNNTNANDDLIPFRNAVAYVASKQGGTLYVPPGDYFISDSIPLPSGIVVQGVGSYQSEGSYNVNFKGLFSRIIIGGSDNAVFRVGLSTKNITIRNLILKDSFNANSNFGANYGIKAVGQNDPETNPELAQDWTVQHVTLSGVIFERFKYGIYITGVDTQWQFDYVKIDHCLFLYNKLAGIYVNTHNSDWNIQSSNFASPSYVSSVNSGDNADGLRIVRAASVVIQNSFGNGDSYNARGGDFIDAQRVGALSVINCASERLWRTFRYGSGAAAHGYSYPITFINNVFGDKIEFHTRATFVSMGNHYSPNTFVSIGGSDPTFTVTSLLDPNVRVNSLGDRFCYEGDCQKNPEDPNGSPLVRAFGSAQVLFATGEVAESTFQARPTIVGTDSKLEVKFYNPYTLNSFTYSFERDPNTGWLKLSGSQSRPYSGFKLNGPLQLPSYTYAELTSSSHVIQGLGGVLVYCSDCANNSSPCTGGGDGALAFYAHSYTWKCR